MHTSKPGDRNSGGVKSWPALGEDLSPLNHFKYLNLSLQAPMSLTILVGRTPLLYKGNGKLIQKRHFRSCLSFLGEKKREARRENEEGKR